MNIVTQPSLAHQDAHYMFKNDICGFKTSLIVLMPYGLLDSHEKFGEICCLFLHCNYEIMAAVSFELHYTRPHTKHNNPANVFVATKFTFYSQLYFLMNTFSV
jgi:hypothetical protein